MDPAAIAKAYAAGYSDDEIVAYLAAKAPEQFKQSKLAGYTSKEILGFLVAEKPQASDTKEAPQGAQAVQITTADKINATVQVFTEPKFYIEMVFVILVLFGAARAKRAARSIPTRVGRLGLVLHWAALLVAGLILAGAGLMATQAQRADDFTVPVVLGVLALVIWLVGKALRYILTGPTEALVSSPVPSAAPLRTTSVPLVDKRTQGPWG